MTKKEKVFYGRILHFSKKIMAINYLGGKCIKCNENNVLKLTFHHREDDNKDFEIGHYLDRHWSRIVPELDKCDLLCCNCHFEIHFPDDRDTLRGSKSKKYFLQFLKIDGCEICGYNKCLSSLDFHHINSENKKLIYEKLKNFKKISMKIDRNLVKDLYNSGMKQIEISKKLNVSKGAINLIIKKINS